MPHKHVLTDGVVCKTSRAELNSAHAHGIVTRSDG